MEIAFQSQMINKLDYSSNDERKKKEGTTTMAKVEIIEMPMVEVLNVHPMKEIRMILLKKVKIMAKK